MKHTGLSLIHIWIASIRFFCFWGLGSSMWHSADHSEYLCRWKGQCDNRNRSSFGTEEASVHRSFQAQCSFEDTCFRPEWLGRKQSASASSIRRKSSPSTMYPRSPSHHTFPYQAGCDPPEPRQNLAAICNIVTHSYLSPYSVPAKLPHRLQCP